MSTFAPELSVANEALVLAALAGSWLFWRSYLMPLLWSCTNHSGAKGGGKMLSSKCNASWPELPEEAPCDGKAEVSWPAAQIRRGHSPNKSVKQTEKQIMELLDNKEFTKALNTFRSLEARGLEYEIVDERFFSEFLQASIRVCKGDVCEMLLSTMLKNGVRPAREFWQTLLKLMSSRSLFSACVAVWNLFREELPLDKTVFSCLINAALEEKKTDIAAEMLPIFTKIPDIEPKDQILVFRVYSIRGDVDACIAALRELGAKASVLMLNLVLRTCVQAHKPEMALEILHEFVGSAKASIDVVSYNTVIKGFAVTGMASTCFECVKEMHQQGLAPDDVTFAILLDVCIAEHDFKQAHRVMESLISSGLAMDTRKCTLFIKGFKAAGKMEKALELYEMMKRDDRMKPDVVTYSVLIRGLAEEKDMESALSLLGEMMGMGLMPDQIILTHLLEGCYRSDNLALSSRIFEDIVAKGVDPSDVTLMTLLKIQGRCGTTEDALQLLQSWPKRFGKKPTVMHYTCFISGCLRAKNFLQAWQGYEFMCHLGVAPDTTVFRTMIPAMAAVKKWDCVLSLIRHALDPKLCSPNLLSRDVVNAALAQLLQNEGTQNEYHVQLLHVSRLLAHAGIPLSASNAQKMSRTLRG